MRTGYQGKGGQGGRLRWGCVPTVCVVVAVGEAAFGSKNKDVCGVGSLMGGDVIAKGRGKGLRLAELEVSADRVT